MNRKAPRALYENIVVQEVADEILICNLKNNRVSCLNVTSAEVWKLSDGQNTVSQIAQLLKTKFGSNASEEIVWLALDQLSKENLLETKIESNPAFSGISRREVIKKIGLGTMIALPLVSSLILPTAAQAQSVSCTGANDPAGCPCSSGLTCASGCCSSEVGGTCNPGC